MTDPGRAALAAAWAVAQIGSQDWDNWCAKFAANAYGQPAAGYNTAAQLGNATITHQARPAGNPLDGAQPGDLLYFRADESNGQAGHAGIYLGGDEMVSATPTGVKRTKILTDPYYGPRFAGWGPAPESWQGPASTPQLVKGAAELIAAAQGGGQKGTNMAGEPRQPTALEQEYQRQVKEHEDRLAPLRQQVDEAQALVDAYTRDKDIPNSKWLPAHGVTMDDVAAAQALLADVRLKRGDVGKALASEQAAIDLAQDRLTKETQRADAEAAKAAATAGKPPPASQAEPAGTKKQVLQQFPDGNQYSVTMIATGTGEWTVDTSAPPQPYGPTKPPTKAADVRWTQRKDGSWLVSEADGSQSRVAIPADRTGTPERWTDPNTGNVYLSNPDGTPGALISQGRPPISTSSNGGIVTGVNTQTGAPAWQTDLRTPAQQAKDSLDAAEAQYQAARSTFVKGLDTPENHAAHPGDYAVWAKAQLDAFDAPHLSRAQALQEQQEARLAAAAQETVRANQAREAEAARTAAETARANQETEQTNRATIAQRAADAATTAETAHQRDFLPAAAASGLQPLYDSFSSGKMPAGLAPTILPRRESPQDVGQRVFEAVMQRLAPVSPLVQQHAQYAPDQGAGQPPSAGAPLGSTTQSTTGTPVQAALLNAITASGALPPPGQQSALPLAPAAYGGAVDTSATLPPMQTGQPINPWRYPAVYG